MKLINGGKILENNQNIAESRVPVGELPGGVITMHVVVQPPLVDKNSGTLSFSIYQTTLGCAVLFQNQLHN